MFCDVPGVYVRTLNLIAFIPNLHILILGYYLKGFYFFEILMITSDISAIL